jgi:aromatic ring-opening dioxygenase LigB subunit
MKKDDASFHTTGLVWGAILPHGPDIVLEVTKDPALMAETRAAMVVAGHQFAAARVDTVILLDPLLVHTQNSFEQRSLFRGEGVLSIGVAAHAGGTMGHVTERFACDESLAQIILEAGRAASFPMASDRGRNDELQLVGGALIPLWFILRPLPQPRPQLVVIAPSPAVPRETLIRFGGLLAEVAGNSGKRVALIASADHGHTHDPRHPRFGYSPAAAQYDTVYCEAVRANRLDSLRDLTDEMLIDSWSDSLWQTLVLAGALDAVPMRVDFLSYAVPSYYGMVVATYEPAAISHRGGR